MNDMESHKIEFWGSYIRDYPEYSGILINATDDIAYFKNGRYHREDGPAVSMTSGSKYWCIEGKFFTEQEWRLKIRKKKLTMLGIVK